MDTQKTRQMESAHKSPLEVETDLQKNVQVVHSELNEVDELSIAEDFNIGGDPYNSTGQHAIVKPRKDATD